MIASSLGTGFLYNNACLSNCRLEVDAMPWDVFNIIGTIAFASSGTVVAMEEGYDILGAFVLGFVASFGGGIVRNILIGVPVSEVWSQSVLLKVALMAMLIVYFLPVRWITRWMRWGNFFDAIGLSAFAIQGGLYAYGTHHGVAAVVAASVLTGIGGGIIRDVLAKRKPLVLRDEIYAIWAIFVGLLIGTGCMTHPWQLYSAFVLVVALRMLSIHFKWKLPRRHLPGLTSSSVEIQRSKAGVHYF